MTDSDKAKIKAIGALLIPGVFPHQEQAGSEKQLLQVYLLAVDGIPADLVGLASRRFLQAQVERTNLQWRPTPPELAAEARRLWDKAREHERLLTARLPAPPSDDPPEPTDEEKQRCAEMWDKAKREIAATTTAMRMPMKPKRFKGAAEPPPPRPEVDTSDFPRAGATRAEIDAWQARQPVEEPEATEGTSA